MSGLNIKLADLQISDFHAPECCFLWWHTEKTFSFWGHCPQTPTRGFTPGPHWGSTAAPRPPHHFPPFSLFPSPMSDIFLMAEMFYSFEWCFTLFDLPLYSFTSVGVNRSVSYINLLFETMAYQYYTRSGFCFQFPFKDRFQNNVESTWRGRPQTHLYQPWLQYSVYQREPAHSPDGTTKRPTGNIFQKWLISSRRRSTTKGKAWTPKSRPLTKQPEGCSRVHSTRRQKELTVLRRSAHRDAHASRPYSKTNRARCALWCLWDDIFEQYLERQLTFRQRQMADLYSREQCFSSVKIYKHLGVN